jgi:signal transduction histidine kinase
MCARAGRCHNGPVGVTSGPDSVASRVATSLRAVEPVTGPGLVGRVLDGALALVLMLMTVTEVIDYAAGNVAVRVRPLGDLRIVVQDAGTSPSTAMLVFAVLASAPLVVRRSYPLSTFCLVMGATLAMTNSAPHVAILTCMIGAYSAAAYSPHRVPALVSLVAAALLVALTRRTSMPNIPNALIPFVLLIPVAVAANAIRLWKRRAAASQQQMRSLEQQQAETTRRAVEFERARIARELHDVVTHNVSVMIVQAGAARKVMDAQPGQAAEALLAVEASGRAAMSELRQVMGLLNAGTQDARPGARRGTGGLDDAAGLDGAVHLNGADLAPQPGLDRLDALVGRVRDTGLAVTLSVSGVPRPVPPGISLAAYRVVQEALTNTVKHAVGASASVAVQYTPHALGLEIADTGGSPGQCAPDGNGRGLIGLRERLAVYGGSLEAGRRLTGGYRVRAMIPLAPGLPADAVPGVVREEA